MARAPTNVSLRLGIDGDAEVKSTFAAIAESGDASAKRLVSSYDRAGEDIEAAMQRRSAAIQKLMSVAPSPVQSRIDSNVTTGFDGRSNASAAEYARLLAQQERQAEALREAVNPLYAAQKRYDDEVRTANSLLSQGAITQKDFAAAVALSQGRLEAHSATLRGGAGASGAMRSATQNLSFQISDVAAQASAGTNPMIIFAQQANQVVFALQGMTEGGTAGAVLRFIGGPWGAVILGAASLLGVWWSRSKDAEDGAKSLGERQKDLAAYFDRTTGAMDRQLTAIQRLAGANATGDVRAGQFKNYREAREDLAKSAQGVLSSVLMTAGGRGVSRADQQALFDALKAFRANGTSDDLAATVNRLAKGNPALAELARTATAAAGGLDKAAQEIALTDARMRQFNGTATAADLKLLGYSSTINTTMLDAQAKLRASTTEVGRAEAKLTIVRELADKALHDKKITEAEYTSRVAAAESAVNAARKAEEDRRKGLTDLTRDTKAFAKSLDELEKHYGSDLSAMETWAKEKALIEAGIASGRFLPSQRDALEAGARLKAQGPVKVDLSTDALKPEQKAGFWADAAKAQFAADKIKASWLELQRVGEQTIDTLLSPDSWKNWRQAGTNAINIIKEELWKLAVINPIKNALFGDGLQTLSGLSGSLGRLFSPGQLTTPTIDWGAVGSMSGLGHNASGTEYFGGGATWVAENGPEIVNLPRGSKITPASETRRLLAGNDNGGPSFHFDLRGAIVTQDILDQMNAIGNGAAVRGAQGGAQLAAVSAARNRRRSLVR